MIEIYDLETARQTILRRDMAAETQYPPKLLASVEHIFGAGATPETAVAKILASVRQDGDAALKHWSQVLDQRDPEDFRVTPDRLASSYQRLTPALSEALKIATDRIRRFHQRQPLPDWQTEDMGGWLGQRVTPIERVGVYVPGGTAPLPSSLLMSAIPAQVAGVRRIIVCTPPNPHPTILASAYLCGIEEVFTVGGAQAIAAMAFGTESIPRVDKIVGAGNIFVTLGKRQVFGIVGLDGLAGPTETMVIADGSARPAWIAADLLAQAEHDTLASAILLTPDRSLAAAVQAEVTRQMEALSRSDIITQSLRNQGGIVITPDLDSAAVLANEFAAEHLCLAVAEPLELAKKINNAGGLFLGEHSFEVLGDYIAGPSHVMPTGATARFASPLNVMDFVKITSMIALDRQTGRALSALATRVAEAETLSAHAAAARLRRDDGDV